MNEVIRVIKERSSTRKYTQQKLTQEELNALIHAGLQAPTAANRQEIHITVLYGGNPILAEIEQEMRAGSDRQWPQTSFYFDAPVVMLLSADEGFSWGPIDTGIAVENITLAAEGLGLGSVIIGCIKKAMTGEKKESFAKRLKLPQGYAFEVAIAVGHKDTVKAPHEYSFEKNVTIL